MSASMDIRFNNKAVVRRLNNNIFATNPREYSAGLMAAFAVAFSLALVRILSSLGAFSAAFFETAAGELIVSLIWPILGGLVVPLFVYFTFSKKGKFKERFSKDIVKQNLHNFGYRRISKQLVVLSIGFGILYGLANQGIAMVSQAIMTVLGLNLGGGAVNYGGIGHLLVMIFTSAILPSICEETVDRGMLVYALKKRGEWQAIIISAAVFAFMHMYIGQTVYTFLMGVVVGYIVVKTGNIIPGLIAHFINNFGATVFHYLYVKDLPGAEVYGLLEFMLEKHAFMLLIVWIGTIVGSVMLARFIVRYHKAQAEHERATKAVQAQQAAIANGSLDESLEQEGVVVEEQNPFEHYEPYKPAFKYEIFLYGAIMITLGATVFSLLWAML